MRKRNKLGIVFHSTSFCEHEHLFTKKTFGKYLENLSLNFNVVFFSNISYRHFSFQDYKISKKIKVICCNNKLLGLYKLYKMFAFLNKIDAVIIFMPSLTGFLAATISILQKKKYILYFGNSDNYYEIKLNNNGADDKNKLKIFFSQQIFKRYQHIIIKKSSLVFGTGPNVVNFLSNYNKHAVQTKPMILFEKKDIVDKSRSHINAQIKLLYVGSLNKAKGIQNLIKACKLLIDDQIPIQVDLVGEGKDYYFFQELIQELGLVNIVFIHNYISNKDSLISMYDNADIFVLPSYSEGFPRVIYEAHSRALPVISTNVGSIPSLLKHKENVYLINPGDITAIYLAVKQLYKNSALYKKLSHNSLSFVKNIFSQTIAEQHAFYINKIYSFDESGKK